MKAPGWGVALIAVAVAAWMGITNKHLRDELASADPEEQVAPRDAVEAASVETVVTEPQSTAVAPPAAVVEATSEPEPEEKKDPEKERQRAREKRMIKAQLGVITDMAYRPFYQEMKIAPETVEVMRGLLVEAMDRDRVTQEMAMKKKDSPASAVKKLKDENKAWLYGELGKVLSKEELAGYEAYEDYADQILFENLLDGQLTMMAPGLTPEGRKTVKEVFAEELVVALDAYEASDDLYTMDGFNDAQLNALNAGLQRLRFDIPQDQFDQATSFKTQVEAVFKSMSDGE